MIILIKDLNHFIEEQVMENLFAKIDDSVTALWVETAGLTVFMSVTFLLAIKLF